MSQVKNWNELTKNERQAVMEFCYTVGKEEKKEALDVIAPILEKELKRLDSSHRYNGAMPLLFRDNLEIKAVFENVEGRYICTNLIGRNDALLSTTICALLCQSKHNFNELGLSNTHFNMIVKLLNEVEPRILLSGMLSYNRPRRIPNEIREWL